jgi:hypothetical protein
MIPEQELKKLSNGGLKERTEPCQEEGRSIRRT